MGNRLRRAARFAGEVVAETLWPTRCVLCERLGYVLCPQCARNLPYLDRWRACPRCGAQYGAVQCTSCDAVSLARLGREELPYDGCAAATVFDDSTGRIVRGFKDHGERRLSQEMAACMARCLPPAWEFDLVTYIPSTRAAYRARGFDHARLIAEDFSALLRGESEAGEDLLLGIPAVQRGFFALACAFERPKTRDQRELSRSQRLSNLSGRFRALPNVCEGRSILVIDDVSTTGATLFAAADALREAGASCVYCMTFARV